ncbi:MAG: two-component system response regulator [Desulfobacteraceae bacterium 4572_88]|nr:MAG: two-component system response regulator [Desulfobacteraceae bacterium 4572_88]
MNDLSHCRILIVDDTKTNIDVLIRAVRDDYKLGVALNGPKAIEFVKNRKPDLILLDVLMPGMDGFEVCRKLKEYPETRDIPIIFITAMDSPDDKTKGFEMGAVDYITKPFDIAEVKARVKTHLSLRVAQETLKNHNITLENKVRERTRELEDAQLEILGRLELATECRDEKTGNHVRRIREYCRVLGKAAGLSSEEYNILALASTMHDVGKIGISDTILFKPGKLTDEERRIMKTHTTIGAKLLAGSDHNLMKVAKIIALTHHERWDGSGYPRGLKGEDIPLEGRIGGICDVFDALVSERPYKKPWTVEKALEKIRSESGNAFDPELVRLFMELEPELKRIVELKFPTGNSPYVSD